MCKLLTVSGTDISHGDGVVFNRGKSTFISIASLDAWSAIVCYRDDTNQGFGTCNRISYSGGTSLSSVGTPLVVNGGETSFTSVTGLDGSSAIVCYQSNNPSGYGACRPLEVMPDGTSLFADKALDINLGQTNYLSVASLGAANAVVCFANSRDLTLVGDGTCRHMNIALAGNGGAKTPYGVNWLVLAAVVAGFALIIFCGVYACWQLGFVGKAAAVPSTAQAAPTEHTPLQQ